MRAHLEFLADDALEGRAPGTRGGLIAAKYIRAQFQRLGLEPAGDSGTYYHRVPIISLTPTPTLTLSGNGASRELRFRDDFVMWSMRNDSLVRYDGDAVFVGYGIVAPEYKWDDYRGVDVKGKVVVALVNDPGIRDSTIFRGRILTYYGRWTYKIEEAERHGAAGLILIHTTESATYPWSAVTSSWTGAQVRVERPATSLLMAGWVTDKAAQSLFPAGTDLPATMRQAATRDFKAVPLGVRLSGQIRSVVRRSETFNVLARLPGTGPLANEAVLIGGHYDHLGVGAPVGGDSIYNGALDNASGTAGMLATAESFRRSGIHTGRSVVFMAFAAEESGLLGSTAFTENPTIPLKRIAAVLNVDVMNLSGRTRDVAALGVDQSSLGKLFTRAAAAEGLRVTTNEDALIRGSFFRSDHFPFARAGIPALSLESGTDFVGRPKEWGQKQVDEYTATRYHQPSDEILPTFSYDGAVQQIRVIIRTAVAVATAKGQPTWNRGSEFRNAGEARLK
ncbi:MAG TPA: M20/M25/M40 family metallo-hydrolase [Candidatus Omnitrophota bacterium]|nr:M20/M25/M40 family metallo-hydrolase [Candidatus Omnitrophota bacterium]